MGAHLRLMLAAADAVRGLSVRQPWSFAIAEGFKPVENRTRRTTFCGQLLIHSSLLVDGVGLDLYSRPAAVRLQELGGRANFWEARAHVPSLINPSPHPTMALGAVIAVATLSGCHQCDGSCSPWAEPGVWHWVLGDVRSLAAPVVCTGRLGLWRPDRETCTAVARSLAGDASYPQPEGE